MYGDVNATIEDGQLGLTASTGTGVHFKIGVSSIVSSVPILITSGMKMSKIKEKLGFSPLYDACLDSIENGSNTIYCIPVAASINGTIGSVTKSGSGTGSLTIAGSPNNNYDIIIEIIDPGELNVASMVYSLDGGYSYSDEVTINLTGVHELTDAGVTVTFVEASADKTNSFLTGDTYSFSTTAPQMSNSDVLTAVEKLINTSYAFEFVHIVGESGKALWASLSTQADNFFSLYKRPLFFVVEGRNKTDVETLDEYASNMITEKKGIENKYIQVVLSYSQYYRADGRTQVINNAGIVCGLYCATERVSQSIGEVKTFPILESKMLQLLPEGIEDYIETLDGEKYLTFRRYMGLDNYYVTSANMMSSDTSDYRYAEDIRVSNKMVKAVRAKALLELQTEVDMSDTETSLGIIAEILTEPLDDMADSKEISSGKVTIDTEQDILTTESIDVSITYVPIGHIREMNISFAMENPYSS